MFVLLFGLACASAPSAVSPSPSVVASSVTPAAPAPSVVSAPSVNDDMVRQLSMRDGAPPCAEIEAGSADPVADLTAIVRTVTTPPTVPMRAAECLIAKGDPAEAELTRWMAGSDTKGLAMLLSDRIDALPPTLAARVVTAGLVGPHAAEVRDRVAKSANPDLRGLAGGAR